MNPFLADNTNPLELSDIARFDPELKRSAIYSRLTRETQLADQLVDLKLEIRFSGPRSEKYSNVDSEIKNSVVQQLQSLLTQYGLPESIAAEATAHYPDAKSSEIKEIQRMVLERTTFGHLNYKSDNPFSSAFKPLLDFVQSNGLAIPEDVQTLIDPYIKIIAKCATDINDLNNSFAYLGSLRTVLDRAIISSALSTSSDVNLETLPALVQQTFPTRKDLEDFFKLQNKIIDERIKASKAIFADLAEDIKAAILDDRNLSSLLKPLQSKGSGAEISIIANDGIERISTLMKAIYDKAVVYRQIEQDDMLDLVYGRKQVVQ